MITIPTLEKFRQRLEAEDELLSEIDLLADGVSPVRYGPEMTTSRGDPKTLDDVVIRQEELRAKWKKLHRENSEELSELEHFLDQVKDPAICTIIRQRYLCRKSWDEVGRLVGCSGEEAYRRLDLFLRKKYF